MVTDGQGMPLHREISPRQTMVKEGNLLLEALHFWSSSLNHSRDDSMQHLETSTNISWSNPSRGCKFIATSRQSSSIDGYYKQISRKGNWGTIYAWRLQAKTHLRGCSHEILADSSECEVFVTITCIHQLIAAIYLTFNGERHI